MSAYTFSVYNASVRDAVHDNKEHPHISERWATPCVFEIEADDAAQAETCIRKKYPPEEGFVAKRLD